VPVVASRIDLNSSTRPVVIVWSSGRQVGGHSATLSFNGQSMGFCATRSQPRDSRQTASHCPSNCWRRSQSRARSTGLARRNTSPVTL
jgi:hypothetical protein